MKKYINKLSFLIAVVIVAFPIYAAAQDARTVATKAVSDADTIRAKGDKASLIASIAKYEEALAIWREFGDKRAEYTALGNIGTVRRDIGEAARSLEDFDKALAVARSLGDKELECYALLYKGVSYDALGNPRGQLELYALALPLAKEIKNQTLELSVLASTGVAYYRLGDFQKAINYYDQTLPLFRATGNKQAEMSVLANMGAIYFTLGDYQRVLDRYELALPLSRELKLEKNEATILGGLGNAYERMGDTQKALDFFNQALAIKKRIGDRIGQAISMIDIASVHLARRDPQSALEFNKQALEIQRELKLRRSEGNTLGNIGKIYIDLHDYDKAFEYSSQALPIRREVGDLEGESVTLHNLAWAELARGHENESLAYCDSGIAIVESIRFALASQELRESFFAVSHDIYKLRVSILMSLDAKKPGNGYDALALQASEQARARSLIDLLTEAKADIRQSADQFLLTRESELRKNINLKESERRKSKTDEATKKLVKEIQDLTTAYSDLQAEIRLKNPRYSELTQPQAFGIKDIQELLDPNTVVLEYSLNNPVSYLWVVSKNSMKSFRLAGQTEIEDKSRTLFGLTKKPETASDAGKAASELGNLLLGPAKSELVGKRLAIVADGALSFVPFAALTIPGNDNPLIVDHEVVYLPSSSALGSLRKDSAGRKAPTKTLAILADPVFDATDTRVKRTEAPQGTAEKNSALEKATRDAGISNSLPRLPGTRNEANAILPLVPEAKRKRSIDFDASLEAVTDPQLADYSIIHFATHGILNSVHPELSGIVLSLVDQKGAPKEGFLRLNDIYNLKLPADVIVLSACQTALGKEIKGEGLVGLTRGFMYAGARRIVASQWSVDDQSTSELMRLFYQGMLGDKKLSPVAALRQAQISLLKTKRFNAPYYWAAFTIQGDWK